MRRTRDWVNEAKENPDHPQAEKEPLPKTFERGDGWYRLNVPEFQTFLEVDRLQRHSGELHGELVVRCGLPGALTYDGILSAGDVNLSSVRSRVERGKYLNQRARVEDVDFTGYLEELAQRIIAMERAGTPAVRLRDLPRPKPDEGLTVEGFPLLARHPSIVFGDGGAAKSLLALYLGGKLDLAGKRVGYFDWELAGEDHRERLERIFGAVMPGLFYARCSRPFVHEQDRLARIVREEKLDYVILDSVAFACDGPPEAAEVAGRYFQALRGLGNVGSLHVAHVSKAEGADQKPFGSAFWHNGARSTWYVKLADGSPESGLVTIALYNRKANLGGLRKAVGYEIGFLEDSTVFRRINVAEHEDLALGLPTKQRMADALKHGAMTTDELAEKLGKTKDNIERTARRNRQAFVLLPGGKLGLTTHD